VILGPPGTALYRADVDLAALASEGDSLLALPSAVTEIQVRVVADGVDQLIHMERNAQGRLAAARLELAAQSITDAETRALDLVLPQLSWWSVRYDVPLEVVGYVIAEVTTGTTRASVGLLGQTKDLVAPFDNIELPAQTRVLISAYRQAICATDLFVSVLSFWRVIEGVRNERTARRERAKSSGLLVTDPPGERIPNSKTWIATHDQWLQQCFYPYLGKKYSVVTEGMRDTLRNALSHIDPTKPVLSLDRNADRDACLRAIPVLRYIARSMLRSELGGETGLGALFAG
jgi:hypothetical protein